MSTLPAADAASVVGARADTFADAGSVADAFADVGAVADAVLFEGYLLYPYRRSSAKNRGDVRFQFGVLAPGGDDGRPRPTVAGAAESSHQQTQVLLEPPRASTGGCALRIRVRFLQLQRRTVERRVPGGYEPVECLEVSGVDYVPFDEAVAVHVDLELSWQETATGATDAVAHVPASREAEELCDEHGTSGGRVVRQRMALEVSVTAVLEPVEAPFRLARLTVVTTNAGGAVPPGTPRRDILARSLLATHTMVAARGARFVSLLDPPAWAAPAAEAAREANHHTFPVLVGDPWRRDLVLSSPIILYDHPQVAPESPGDLFDATEIDEILSLRTMTLTDAERREARATDPRAAAILDRLDHMPPEVLARLHGVVRDMTRLEPAAADGPASVILGSGEHASRGDLVRLWPRPGGADAGDMFLAGRVAKVETIFDDLDGGVHVAVTLPEDPGADLQQWYGRYFYFAPDELCLAEPSESGKR